MIEKYKIKEFGILAIIIYPLLFCLHGILSVDVSDGGYALSRYIFFGQSYLDLPFYLSNALGHLILSLSNSVLFLRGVSLSIYGLSGYIAFLYARRKGISTLGSALGIFIAHSMQLSFPLEIIHNPMVSLFSMLFVVISYKGFEKKSIKIDFLIGIIITLTSFFRILNILFIVPYLILILYNREGAKKRVLAIISGILFSILLSVGLLYSIGRGSQIKETIEYLFLMATQETTHNLLYLAGRYAEHLILIITTAIILNYGRKRRKLTRYKIFTQKWFYAAVFLSGFSGLLLLMSLRSIKSGLSSIYVVVLGYTLSIYINRFKEGSTKEKQQIIIEIAMFCMVWAGSSSSIHYGRINTLMIMPVMAEDLVKRGNYWIGLKFEKLVLSVLILALTSFYLVLPYREGFITSLNTPVTISGFNGIKTYPEKAQTLNQINKLKDLDNWDEYSLITHGSIPILHYIFPIKPALSSPWPDLDTFNPGRYEKELNNFNGKLLIAISQVDVTNNRWTIEKQTKKTKTNQLKLNLLLKEKEKRKMDLIYKDNYVWIYKEN